MTIPFDELLVGYDYDVWYEYADKEPVSIDASTKNNTQTLIFGMSGWIGYNKLDRYFKVM